MASNKTVVKGIRADKSFFDKCDLVAKELGLDRNKLIVIVMSEYLNKFENNREKIKEEIFKGVQPLSCFVRPIRAKIAEGSFELICDLIKSDLVEKTEND